MTSPSPGWILIGAGLLLVLIGLLSLAGALHWFGRLPGDIRITRESVRVYLPLVSMLIVSVVLSLLWHLGRRFLR
jgi:hypothetical protein